VEVGYEIAVKDPALLGKPDLALAFMGSSPSTPCYCFWKEGKAGGEFDDHGANCNICIGQAMLTCLWKNLGVTEQEILKGKERIFERLMKEREGGKDSHRRTRRNTMWRRKRQRRMIASSLFD